MLPYFLTRLTSKFRVNSQDKKADHLEKLVAKFVDLPLLQSSAKDVIQVMQLHKSCWLRFGLDSSKMSKNGS